MSDPLRDLNREEWSDKPFVIELRGGRSDGQRFRWHELPYAWRQPEPAALSITSADFDFEPSTARLGMPVALYKTADRVTDEGVHIYEFDGYER